ncbi:MAG: hypothetical protein EOP24_31995 [Hyphomicrobiales bacterium]|nr:MAG: hypothetical protein EOP24_31995 [Hyphomicrobiales bacterium]
MNASASPATDPRRRDLNQWAVNSWGTAGILEQRVSTYSRWLQANGYVGFIIPVVVGGFALAFGVDGLTLKTMLLVSAGLLFVQGVMSATLTFAGIESKMRACQDSASINKVYATEARELATGLALEGSAFASFYAEIKGKVKAQETNDERLRFSAKDRRRAARIGMKRFELPCGGCNQIPRTADAKSDKSTCPDCGDI